MGFETEMQTQGFMQAVQAILVSIVAVYLVMVLTFRSFVHPFTILFSLPLALIGAAFALWVTDRVLGISVLVGLMMLVGIVGDKRHRADRPGPGQPQEARHECP